MVQYYYRLVHLSKENKVAINTDPTLTKDILKPINLPVVEPEQPVVEEPVIEDPSQITEQDVNLVNTDNTQGEIKLAGMGKVVTDAMKSAKDAVSSTVLSSEKKVYGSMKATEDVTDQGGYLLIKPTEDIDLNDLLNTITEGKNPGINFVKLGEKLTSDESLKAVFAFDQYDQNLAGFMEQVKNANKELFTKLRRDTVTVESATKLAEKNGLYNVIMKMAGRKPGEVLPAEDTLGAIIGLVNMSELAQQASRKALQSGDPKDQMVAFQLISFTSRLSASLSGNVSEYARGMSTLRHAGKITPSGNITEYANHINGLLERFDSPESLETLLDTYVRVPKQIRPMFAKQALGARSVDAVIEVWLNSILTSPVTHLVNIAGNSIFQGLKVMETGLAGGIGAVRTTITGADNSDRILMGEALASVHGIQNSFFDALILSSKALWDEQPVMDGSKLDLGTNKAIGSTGNISEIVNKMKEGHYGPAFVDSLGVYFRMSGRALVGEDEFFKVIAMRASISKQAYRKSIIAYDDALKGGLSKEDAMLKSKTVYAETFTNPPIDVFEAGAKEAKELTFQGDLDGFFGSLAPTMNHPIAKLFVPFYKTPVNIFTEVFDRSLPFNVYSKFKNGTGREKDEAMAKITMGAGIGYVVSSLVSGTASEDFFCTGSGPTDRGAKQALDRLNIPRYSCTFKMDDGTMRSVTFSRFDPVSGLLAMAVDYSYFVQHEDDPDVLLEMATAFTLATTDYIDQHPMMQGLSDMTKIIMKPNPNMSGEERFERFVELVSEKVSAVAFSLAPTQQSYIPSNSSWSATKERIKFPNASNTMLPEGYTELPPAMRGFYLALQKAKSRNPLFSEELPPRLNLWGEVRQQGNGMGWEWFSPVHIRDKKYNAVDEEIIALGNAGASGPLMPNKKIDKVLLTAQEYNDMITLFNTVDGRGRFQTDTGYDATTTILPSLDKLIKSDMYKLEPLADERMKMIKDVISEYMGESRDYLIETSPRLRARIIR